MGGIEFYPQKEFDEDMEDKSDNDKIRVSGSVFSFTLIHPVRFFPLLPSSSPSSLAKHVTHLGAASSKQNVRALRHIFYLFSLINFVQLSSVH